jgi:CheY-like chemotaxis protein
MEHNPYICAIDDDTTIGDLIAEVLTDEGYIVLADSTGAGALPTIAAHPPALCLVDLRMPGMSGLEVIEHLRMRGLEQVPVVGMTASTQDAELVRAAGLVCLDKPFDIDELLACVARYVPLQQVLIAQTACQTNSELSA